MLGLFVRALFTFQRRAARRLGVARPLTGAVAFVQRFGSALQLTPHFHVLVPEAVFATKAPVCSSLDRSLAGKLRTLLQALEG